MIQPSMLSCWICANPAASAKLPLSYGVTAQANVRDKHHYQWFLVVKAVNLQLLTHSHKETMREVITVVGSVNMGWIFSHIAHLHSSSMPNKFPINKKYYCLNMIVNNVSK